mmetsp:Transcript_80265/g.159531  ORF Transcript_80265/g.159531 Transcript_80265/m.159531 type:complete len:827 (-) Transcript_80265:512-2992(-)|eukprot:CAMPEP_0174694084 /NCGR_PEP_ID=MMETSP1094-20130205/723_1 /TAXON_ID=156173 /ORGANISM="Chrysochromulina brevifilum, Strain UTEX LB 985" /LENGTH=826 /DNA_ID=CAMNT_0015890217 /DNA_START=149 /DNA_END=2629 /DNA_ORIENTATION=+
MDPVASGLEAAISSLDKKSEFVALAKMQQMVRVTCLEVMGSAPSQVESYRREVLELQNLVKGYLSEVQELRQQQTQQMQQLTRVNSIDWTPSSPSTASVTDSVVPGSPVPLLLLDASFEEHPERSWYENKPLPRFTVQLRQPSGELYANDDMVLRASVLNGRGMVEERRVTGAGELLTGDRNAPVIGGVAAWETLRVSEPSSKHYGSFTMVITAAAAPDGYGMTELHSQPLTIQVGRMWSKRRKSEAELSPDDPITQIPGVGARYVSRLQLHGVSTIGQFAAMAATEQGRDTLCRLCKGDNPRNSLNAQKLQQMIDTASKVAVADAQDGGPSAKRRALPAQSAALPPALLTSGAEPPTLEAEPSFSMDELFLLATDDNGDIQSPSTPSYSPLTAASFDAEQIGIMGDSMGQLGGLDDVEDHLVPRVRRLQVVQVESQPYADAAAPTIDILPPKAETASAQINILPPKSQSGELTGFAAFDALDNAFAPAPAAQPIAAQPIRSRPFAPASAPLASSISAAWRGDAAALYSVSAVGVDKFGCSSLHVAALGGHEEAVRVLLSTADFVAMIDARAAGMGGATALLLAASRGEETEAAAAALLEAGASPSVLLSGDVSGAHLAAWSGSAATLQRLITAAPSLLDATSRAGLSPLEYAALGGHEACVQMLLQLGARGGLELPPLHCAALGGSNEIVAALLASHPEQIALQSARGGWLPLHAAAVAPSLDAIKQLLAAGADVHELTRDGLSALDLACACAHSEVAAALIEAGGADLIRTSDPRECTPLLCAAVGGDADCMRVLMAHGAEEIGAVVAAAERLHGGDTGLLELC